MHTDAGDLPRPLRVHTEWHGEDAQGEGDDAHDSAEPHDDLLKSVPVSLMLPFLFPWQPNARHELLPEAGAQRRLEAVSCKTLLSPNDFVEALDDS